ncbi:hypothetical protein PTSG_11131 [Salpingoeca rosetta]|uniref:Uncharacterized protein n=1 Tax=Salpingoeca rosetta (strain ATCC 50818 / BSB-021) TaxID=946362 RepID=F2US83_SALR5|nr:uncharacterized protein PTSG_11131 [Salpingoeca rosetta]EGD80488.1 hypothetical protein PTSG_11131 [Salpingoeca rosetta]|eukprot:XP_004988052.1 hypothetical protein PTSG_11131 [Salpingoeca rosetta]
MPADTHHNNDPSTSLALKLFFLVCGLSVFARSEAVFMQTQMYAKCFGLGDRFYALASCAIFMPGILVQIIQNKYDVLHDLKYGTYKATTTRLLVAVLGSVAALLGLVLGAFENMKLEGDLGFIYALMGVLGLGISISFGCFVQVITMFPPSMHPFFFVGTYSPFLIFAPINIAVQDLCVKDEDDHWMVRWHSVLVYYLLAAFLTLAGLLCYFGIAKHPRGKAVFKRKDAELRAALVRAQLTSADDDSTYGSVNRRTKDGNSQHTPLLPAGSSAVSGDGASVVAGTTRRRSSSIKRANYGSSNNASADVASLHNNSNSNNGRHHHGSDDEEADSDVEDGSTSAMMPLLNGSSGSSSSSSAPPTSSSFGRRDHGKPSAATVADALSTASSHYTNWDMLRMCWKEMTAQLLMTVCSTLVASLYIKFKPTQYDDLPTLLQYDYYICGALGILTTSIDVVRRALTSRIILILSFVRLLVIPFAILYARDVLPRSDIGVLVVNGLQMYVGGGVFALAFSHASNQFAAKPDRTKASTIMNTCYYIAMAIALGVSLAIT